MDGPARILGLVARVRARLWRQESLRLLRFGIYGSAALLAVCGGLRLWPAALFVGHAVGANHALAAGTARHGRGARGRGAGRTPPPECRGGRPHRGRLGTGRATPDHRLGDRPPGGAATAARLIVVRQAERALPVWEARVRARHPRPTPASLLPPLLFCGATVPWVLLSASGGQPPRAAHTATPPPMMTAPGGGLAAAIADLSPPSDPAAAPTVPVSKSPARGDQAGQGQLESDPGPGAGRATNQRR